MASSLSMAEAGEPLRQETFYYAHRKGGVQVLPVDVEALVRRLLPEPSEADYAFLVRSGYEMGAGFKAAMLRRERLTVHALPRGALFYPREPVFSMSGPSALVSWLEPLLRTPPPAPARRACTRCSFSRTGWMRRPLASSRNCGGWWSGSLKQ